MLAAKGDGEARLKKRTGIPGLRAVNDVSAWPFGSGSFCSCSTLLPRACLPASLHAWAGGLLAMYGWSTYRQICLPPAQVPQQATIPRRRRPAIASLGTLISHGQSLRVNARRHLPAGTQSLLP